MKSSQECTRVCVLSRSGVSHSLWSFGLQPLVFLYPWNFSGKNTGVGCCFLLQGNLPNPGIKPMSLESPALQVDSLPSELPGKCICRWSRHCSHLHYWWRSQVSGSLANMTGIVQSGTRGERMCSPAIWAQGPCSEPPRASSFLGVLNVPQTVGQWKELLKHFLCMVLTMYFFILWKKR